MHATTTRIAMNKNKCKYTECESLTKGIHMKRVRKKKEKKKEEEKEKRKQIKEKKTSSNKILPLYIKII